MITTLDSIDLILSELHLCLRWDGVALPRNPLYHGTGCSSPLQDPCQGQALLVGYLLAMILAAIA